MIIKKYDKIISNEKSNMFAIYAVIKDTEKEFTWAGIIGHDNKEEAADLGDNAVRLVEAGYELLTNGSFEYASFTWDALERMSVDELNTLLTEAGLSQYSVAEDEENGI